MESRPPIIVVVPDRDDLVSESNVLSSEFFVSPLPQPKTKPASPSHDGEFNRDYSSKHDTDSVETDSVASDIDSSFDGSSLSNHSMESSEEEEKDESTEFEVEVKKLKLLRQQQAQLNLKHPHATHPFVQQHGLQQNPFRHPQHQFQLHPAQAKKLRESKMQDQTDMIQEIHSMLSLLIDDHNSSQTSGSSSDSSMKKSQSRNTTQSKRDIALLAKEKLKEFETNVQSLRKEAENFDTRDSSLNSFKDISAPPLWLEANRRSKDEMVVSKRLVKPDDISSKLLSDRHTSHQRVVKPQPPKRGKALATSLHENFDSGCNHSKSSEKQRPKRESSHSRSTPTTPSMHERFSGSFSSFNSFASFDEMTPQVQKALRMSSHRRKMPAAPTMQDRFSQSLNLERSSMVAKNTARRHSLQVPTLTVDERFSEHFELELEPDDEESVEAMPEPSKMPEPTKSPEPQKASVLSSLASRFSKSPVIQKALKLSTHNRSRTPRRTRKGNKSSRSTPSRSSTSSSHTLNKRSKKRVKSGKGSKQQEPPTRSVTPEYSRHSRRMLASPGMDKSMIGEKLQKQIHKTQPDLAGRITDVLMNYNNAEELMHMLEGPEEDMTERIVEVLEVLQGRESSRPKQQTVKA